MSTLADILLQYANPLADVRWRITVSHTGALWQTSLSVPAGPITKTRTYLTQHEAEDAAQQFARALEAFGIKSELRVQRSNHRFGTASTYGGIDPFPPRG